VSLRRTALTIETQRRERDGQVWQWKEFYNRSAFSEVIEKCNVKLFCTRCRSMLSVDTFIAKINCKNVAPHTRFFIPDSIISSRTCQIIFFFVNLQCRIGSILWTGRDGPNLLFLWVFTARRFAIRTV